MREKVGLAENHQLAQGVTWLRSGTATPAASSMQPHTTRASSSRWGPPRRRDDAAAVAAAGAAGCRPAAEPGRRAAAVGEARARVAAEKAAAVATGLPWRSTASRHRRPVGTGSRRSPAARAPHGRCPYCMNIGEPSIPDGGRINLHYESDVVF